MPSFHAAASSSSADLHRSANVLEPESLYKIKNPNYKGKWKTPWIDNPEFEDDPHLYVLKPIKYVGVEVWQVRLLTLYY
ncbi:calreticulin-3-like [Camellia sinensis]|uniref:calreticulin-3-like n=1 Tax=Camellia sinensis TaxID=4442 RepID=UPI0010365C06|nr:calreticulin-3-like [Camellia sinensis]